MAESASILGSLREKYPDLPDRAFDLLEIFGQQHLPHLSDAPTVQSLREAVEAALQGLRTDIKGDTPGPPSDTSETVITTLTGDSTSRQYFLLGLSLKEDGGSETLQAILEGQESYRKYALRHVQKCGADALEKRLTNRRFLSEDDLSTLAAVDWESISAQKRSGYASPI
jgi:hypothetical protein